MRGQKREHVKIESESGPPDVGPEQVVRFRASREE